MQTVTTDFTARANKALRLVTGGVFISFGKSFNSGLDFFTLDTSTLDGGDVLAGEGDVIQEWDKYAYTDYSNRLISLEWSRQEDPVSSVVLATADVVLDNHDGFFTPGAGSAIDGFILPQRPIKLQSGFRHENVPVFVGVTEKMPEIDKQGGTVRFHCIDFMQTLLNRPLEETVLYENMRTDEILSALFVAVGLLPSQFLLDTGFNIVYFAFWPAGTLLGEAIDQLMVAEQGRLFMDENGMIRFKNRQNYPTTPVWAFDGSNTLQARSVKYDDIVNVVEIRGKVRQVQTLQKVWELGEPILVPAGGQAEVWASFEDPVTTCDDPDYVDSATTSFFATNTLQEGTGDPGAGSVTLTDSDLFATSFKMTFSNSGSVDLYLINIGLFGTPAKVIREIFVREQDDTSVGKYDEHVLRIRNDFIQTADDARTRAKVLLDDYSELGTHQELTVKGNPALQVGDMIGVGIEPSGESIITKINGRLMNASFKQILNVKQFTRRTYFTLDSSSLDGADVLAP